VVIWDVDWSTVSSQSRDPERMRRMLDAWDTHLTHPALPRTLASALRRAGFHNVEMAGHAFATTAWDPETYGGALVDKIVRHAVEKGGMAEDDSQAWKSEQQKLDAVGEFYFACMQ
jgi:arsenite methyltransferase